MIQEDYEEGVVKVGLFFLFAAIYFLLFKDSGDYYISKPIVHIAVAGFVLIVGSTGFWVSRYFMPHVTVNGHTGSVLDRPTYIKDRQNTTWAVFGTGAHLWPFPGKGKIATLVVPADQLKKAGRNYVGLTFCSKHPVSKLPPAVYSFLQRNESTYNLDRVFFGKHTEKWYNMEGSSEAKQYEEQIESLWDQINMRDDIIEKRNDTIVELRKVGEEISGTKNTLKDYLPTKRNKEADQYESS